MPVTVVTALEKQFNHILETVPETMEQKPKGSRSRSGSALQPLATLAGVGGDKHNTMAWSQFLGFAHAEYPTLSTGPCAQDFSELLGRVWTGVLIPLTLEKDPHTPPGRVTLYAWQQVFGNGLVLSDPKIIAMLFYEVYKGTDTYGTHDTFELWDMHTAVEWWKHVNDALGVTRCCSGTSDEQALRQQYFTLQAYVEEVWKMRSGDRLTLRDLTEALQANPTLALGLRLLL
eukprot:TRINITY_DN115156_c0_g1_i1.p1 TRINITY_DN115156_c0_g1~~TRINITY_DN115156_c0_g1_i1.p1  ORF type:complete len:244 (-),score=17.66 TRINITY_DN115156_c0_g1_i1:191-883(-)